MKESDFMPQIGYILLLACFALSAHASEHGQAISREQALAKLRAGNERFVSGQPHDWSADAAKREELVKGQEPFACVITCADSRVPPEILFDQSLGDVFVIRLAGNVITQEVTGSVDYAVEHLHVPVVVVLGHSSCGAVGAALSDTPAEGPIGSLIALIKPSIDAAKRKGFSGDDLGPAAISENARHSVDALVQSSRAIDEGIQKGTLTVLSAIYDLSSGRVDWQTQVSAAVVPASVASAAEDTHENSAAGTEVEKVAPKAQTADAKETKETKHSTHSEEYARRH
jgi:carbonic anhydrase